MSSTFFEIILSCVVILFLIRLFEIEIFSVSAAARYTMLFLIVFFVQIAMMFTANPNTKPVATNLNDPEIWQTQVALNTEV